MYTVWPSGCAVTSLQVSAISDVVVRGELSITTENCQTYCAAIRTFHSEGKMARTWPLRYDSVWQRHRTRRRDSGGHVGSNDESISGHRTAPAR